MAFFFVEIKAASLKPLSWMKSPVRICVNEITLRHLLSRLCTSWLTLVLLTGEIYLATRLETNKYILLFCNAFPPPPLPPTTPSQSPDLAQRTLCTHTQFCDTQIHNVIKMQGPAYSQYNGMRRVNYLIDLNTLTLILSTPNPDACLVS